MQQLEASLLLAALSGHPDIFPLKLPGSVQLDACVAYTLLLENQARRRPLQHQSLRNQGLEELT